MFARLCQITIKLSLQYFSRENKYLILLTAPKWHVVCCFPRSKKNSSQLYINANKRKAYQSNNYETTDHKESNEFWGRKIWKLHRTEIPICNVA